MAFELSAGEHICSARPEFAYGAGWTNTPIWVIIREPDGTYRKECLQPEEQTEEMRLLFEITAKAQDLMTGLIKKKYVVEEAKDKRVRDIWENRMGRQYLLLAEYNGSWAAVRLDTDELCIIPKDMVGSLSILLERDGKVMPPE